MCMYIPVMHPLYILKFYIFKKKKCLCQICETEDLTFTNKSLKQKAGNKNK